MPDHAGFAAAVTVREHVLRIALQTAYANGVFPKQLRAPLPGDDPDVLVDVFIGQPDIACEGSNNVLVLTLQMWGSLRITLDNTNHDVAIVGEVEVTVRPKFGPGSTLQFEPENDDIVVRRWTASVTSTATPPEVVDFVVGDQFKARLQRAIRLAIAFRLFKLPGIAVSFFGPLARIATSVDARVGNGVLLIGLNVDNDTDFIVGDVNALVDFARSYDVAGVVNAVAAALLLDDMHTRLLEGAEAEGASLNRFSVESRAGYFYVSGAVSKSSVTLNFSFRVVPTMFHTRPGTVFHYLPKTRWVNSRTWPALDFHVEGVDTDVDRPWWGVVLEIFTGILTLGFAALYVEDLISDAAVNFSGRVKAAKTGGPAARVRRAVAPPGGIGVRVAVDQFDITAAGTYVGVTTQAIPTAAALIGPTTVPSIYSGDILRYLLRLPSGITEIDPALRVRWTLEDRTNNVVLVDADGSAAGRMRFDFSPDAHPGAGDFGVSARVYRRLGPDVTELGLASLNVHMRGALPSPAYVRWRSQVKNPQIGLDERTETWSYNGEAQVRRWSEWHRIDAPCRAVTAENRYRTDFEEADRLPFALRLLENHRKGLCPYCFFGGPAGLNAAL